MTRSSRRVAPNHLAHLGRRVRFCFRAHLFCWSCPDRLGLLDRCARRGHRACPDFQACLGPQASRCHQERLGLQTRPVCWADLGLRTLGPVLVVEPVWGFGLVRVIGHVWLVGPVWVFGLL